MGVPGDGQVRVAYVFEAKGIQPFLAAGGRLRDLVGASLLIESLCAPEDAGGAPGSGLLDHAMRASGVVALEPAFTRRAAGCFAFVLAGPEAPARVEAFRAVWTLLVQHAAPGLPFVDMIGVGPNVAIAMRQALQRGDARRALMPAPLALAGPLARLAPRTGEPAVAELAPQERDAAERVADLATLRKRRFADAALVAERINDDFWPGRPAGLRWPRDMETEFPWRGETRSIGVLHADGNRLGQVLMTLKDAAWPGEASGDALTAKEKAWVAIFARFSKAVDTATWAAAAQAADKVLLPVLLDPATQELRRDAGGHALTHVPARPVLLGGDDITILVRGDLAIPFAEEFLTRFEDEAKREIEQLELRPLLQGKPIPALTACAGLAIVGASQPVAQALALAESLCGFAKHQAKRGLSDQMPVPSCLAMHRATASLLDSYEVVRRDELDGGRLTQNPYGVGRHGQNRDMPPLSGLRRLKDALGDGAGARGPAREIAGLLHLGPTLAKERYARWRAVLLQRAPAVLAEFDAALGELGFTGKSERPGQPARPEPAKLLDDPKSSLPLLDALSWLAAEAGA
ncbi:Cas10/Cmr2 second palm domain-containing protein [Falsiroseomonas sp.]|uniref:Cas10/Cmr2 second palm domain-containing protein n=1 Tax=Falsiroseomonas sp. TaxID=2870721 RepID=UPI003F71199A